MENGERKFKRHYVIGLTLLTLISGWGGAALMLGAYPKHYVEWLFLGMKVAKMLLFVLLIGLYTSLVDVRNTEFVVTFLAYYLIFLLFETVFFWHYENKLKKNEGNE